MLDRRQFLLALAVGAYALPLRAQTTAQPIHRVEIRGFAFVPSRIEVRAGDIIEWINRDFAPHTATEDNNHRWDTGSLRKEATGRWTTTQPGEFAYHCTFHPHMKGVIIVVARAVRSAPSLTKSGPEPRFSFEFRSGYSRLLPLHLDRNI